MDVVAGTWDAGRWHHGVGPWSTWVVLIAPFMFALIAPPPAGFGGGTRLMVAGLALLALLIVTARMTDNRVVWIALAAVFAHRVARRRVALAADVHAHADALDRAARRAAARARARVRRRARGARGDRRANGSVAVSIERDPRIVLWEHISERIAERPFTGYGFGRRILAGPLPRRWAIRCSRTRTTCSRASGCRRGRCGRRHS